MNPTCCCAVCLIGSDDFDGPDSSDLGPDWTEESGEWEKISKQLQCTTRPGELRYEKPHPEGPDAPQEAEALITLTGSAPHKARVRLKVQDANNYLFAELERDASGCATLRLGRKSGGSETWLQEPQPIEGLAIDSPFTLKACHVAGSYSCGGIFLAQIGGTITSAYVDASGSKVGLGNPTGSMKFDNFTFHYHEAAGHEYCPECWPNAGVDSCVIGSDNFNRADSASLGCLWEEISGTSEIASGQLKWTAAGVIRYKKHHPLGKRTMLGSIEHIANSGDRVRVLVNGNKTLSSYLAAEAEFSTTLITLRLIKNGTTIKTATKAGTFTYPATYTICASWDDLTLCGTIRDVIADTVATTSIGTQPIDDGIFAGLASMVGSAVLMDNFFFLRVIDANDPEQGEMYPNPDCEPGPSDRTCTGCCSRTTSTCCGTTLELPRYMLTRVEGVGNGGCDSCGRFNASFLLPPGYVGADPKDCYRIEARIKTCPLGDNAVRWLAENDPAYVTVGNCEQYDSTKNNVACFGHSGNPNFPKGMIQGPRVGICTVRSNGCNSPCGSGIGACDSFYQGQDSWDDFCNSFCDCLAGPPDGHYMVWAIALMEYYRNGQVCDLSIPFGPCWPCDVFQPIFGTGPQIMLWSACAPLTLHPKDFVDFELLPLQDSGYKLYDGSCNLVNPCRRACQINNSRIYLTGVQ